ncbi:MAG: hypothetical protein JXA99_16700 [Candidatus Lokiarchaeota archaeon]|nr:hypothetical protein [Candidatus Lokiarchaeota archaeon]
MLNINYKKLESIMREFNISCPTCGIDKIVKIPTEIFSKKESGCVKIHVPAGIVCSDHQFVVFIDQKGIIRGYEKIDLILATKTTELK